ncbi:MAG: hypothetical protein NC191_09435 [Muribaculaceae bacterium]|nr:hypothetical protein [Muribaculaceae bacterium]
MFNVVVGVPQNGRQTIALRSKNGMMREVSATEKEVAEFIEQRQKYGNFNKSYAVSTGLGAGIGVVSGLLSKFKSVPQLACLGLFGAAIGALVNSSLQLSKRAKSDENFILQHS